MKNNVPMTPELYNLLTLPEVLDKATTLPVEDLDGNAYDVLEMIENAFASIQQNG